MSLKEQWTFQAKKVDNFIIEYWNKFSNSNQLNIENYIESMKYSTIDGGKRFRPVLSAFTAKALNFSEDKVLPFGVALEFIHCFSLIHDDLPCMDDDDMRRGKASNHIEFGEATALLAGDGLIMEAVQLILSSYQDKPSLALQLARLLMEAAGSKGMIAGQILDLKAKETKQHLENIERVHLYKTGALIRAAVKGAALIANANSSQLENLDEYAKNLGIAFQVADDLLELNDGIEELGSYPGILGKEASEKHLQDLSDSAIKSLNNFGENAELLRAVVEFNHSRNH